MSLYIKRGTGDEPDVYPYTIAALKADNPNTSFPAIVSDALLADFNVYPVTPTDKPDFDALTQTVDEQSPNETDGVWTQVWAVQAAPTAIQEMRVRGERDKLLAATDYLALSDQTLSAEMVTYRQALRDVPAQSGFPTSVAWPTKP